MNINEIEAQWKKGVGGTQKLLPMHVVDEYGSASPFKPVPNFTNKPKSPPTLHKRQFFNRATKQIENWLDSRSRLGVDLAIFKGEGKCAWAPRGGVGFDHPVFWDCRGDLVAVRRLYIVRCQDFQNLKSRLEERTISDNHTDFSDCR